VSAVKGRLSKEPLARYSSSAFFTVSSEAATVLLLTLSAAAWVVRVYTG